jgi:superfamily I DNA and/or RNA helicase
MVSSICAFVSDLSYAGRLRTAPTLRKIRSEVSALPGGGLHLLDTSRLDSTTDFKGRSRFNEVHAELIVELVRSIEEDLSNPATCLLVTPFRAQAQILNRSLRREHLRTRATTVHRAQGAEADVVIVDLVETDAFHVSPFLTARGPDNEWARLLNVAVSRAKRAVVVVAAVDPLLQSPATGRYVKAFLATLRQDANPLDPTAYRRQADSLAA